MNAYTELTITLGQNELSAEQKLAYVCQQTVKHVPNANRVSLWRFSVAKDSILCLKSYDQLDDTYAEGLRLMQNDYPEYFAALLQNRWLMASNARTDPQTERFNKDYFLPNHIHSLLDFVIKRDEQAIGIICCESAGKRVTWNQSDLEALNQIANVVAGLFTN